MRHQRRLTLVPGVRRALPGPPQTGLREEPEGPEMQIGHSPPPAMVGIASPPSPQLPQSCLWAPRGPASPGLVQAAGSKGADLRLGHWMATVARGGHYMAEPSPGQHRFSPGLVLVQEPRLIPCSGVLVQPGPFLVQGPCLVGFRRPGSVLV